MKYQAKSTSKFVSNNPVTRHAKSTSKFIPNNPITRCLMIWSSNFLDKLRARRSYTKLLLNIRTCSVSGPAGSQQRRLLGRCPIGRPGPLWPRIRPCRQGRRACYGPLCPAPYLKPKEIFSTPAFQPSPTSKEQGNCRASASLALPALHPALLALPPQLRSTPIPEALAVARPSSTRPARPSSAVAPPLVLSPSA